MAAGEAIPVDVQNLITQSITKSMDDWFGYKLGRQAMRYGQFRIASEIFHNLSQHVRTLKSSYLKVSQGFESLAFLELFNIFKVTMTVL